MTFFNKTDLAGKSSPERLPLDPPIIIKNNPYTSKSYTVQEVLRIMRETPYDDI